MNFDLCSGKPEDVAEDDVECRSSLNDLPDEILILIFNRLLDLKCLCLCSLVSPRFSSLILLHVHFITFTVPDYTTAVPLPTPPSDTLSNKLLAVVAKPFQYFRQFVAAAARMVLPPYDFFFHYSFESAVCFLSRFKSIRSFHLIVPSSPHKLNSNPNCKDSLLFKWTAKCGPTIDTFVFLSTSSIRAANFYDDEPELERTSSECLKHRGHLAFECLKDARAWHQMLLFFIKQHPLLQNITITDSKNQGNLSLRDSNLAETRDQIKSELEKNEVTYSFPVSYELWHVPLLELPVSGKVMKNAALVLMKMVDRSHLHRDLGGDAAAIANLYGKGEEEFGEAIVEMMVNHQSRSSRFDQV